MSNADTSEYALESLAETLTRLSKAITGTSSYRESYVAALSDVAHDMGLSVHRSYTYP